MAGSLTVRDHKRHGDSLGFLRWFHSAAVLETTTGHMACASAGLSPGISWRPMRIGLVLFLVALSIRVVAVLVTGFDGLYGQDAFAYYDQAVAIAHRVPRGESPPSDFFWPNGYPAVAALFMWLVGQRPAAAQLVSVLSGAALAPLTYLLCRDLFPQASTRAGVIAALVVAVAGLAVVSSVVVMADMPALFWSALAAWLTVRAWRRTRGSFEMVASGAALAMAIVTRWFSGVLLPILLIYGFSPSTRHTPVGSPGNARRRRGRADRSAAGHAERLASGGPPAQLADGLATAERLSIVV